MIIIPLRHHHIQHSVPDNMGGHIGHELRLGTIQGQVVAFLFQESLPAVFPDISCGVGNVIEDIIPSSPVILAEGILVMASVSQNIITAVDHHAQGIEIGVGAEPIFRAVEVVFLDFGLNSGNSAETDYKRDDEFIYLHRY